ncbi:cysteine peptidase family C39 domain-containing protein [Pseudobutyrivibrio sp.]
MKLKGVYQHDIHDCGAACIATICSFYGSFDSSYFNAN